MDWLSVITAAGGVAGFSGLISVLLYLRPTRRKINAEARQIEAAAENEQSQVADRTLDGAFKLIGKLETRLEQTEWKLASIEAENQKFKELAERALRRITYLMHGIKLLVEQLKKNLLEPVWEPDEWKYEGNDT